jgi:integration host factor subunit alpha
MPIIIPPKEQTISFVQNQEGSDMKKPMGKATMDIMKDNADIKNIRMTITKRNIIDVIYSKFNMTKRESDEIVESIFEIIKDELANGNDVMISGFGKWLVRKRKANTCRNPQTGKLMLTNERVVITFRNSPKLKKDINKEVIGSIKCGVNPTFCTKCDRVFRQDH